MRDALKRSVPDARFHPPSGGLFLWVRVPGSADAADLVNRCSAEGLLVRGGSRSFLDGSSGGERYLRLNFAQPPFDAIEEGIARLARALGRTR